MKLGARSTSSYPNMCRRESGPKIGGIFGNRHSSSHMTLIMDECDITSLINSTRLLKSTCAQKLVPQLRSSRFFKLRMTRTRQSPSRMAKSLLRSSRESNSSGESFCIEKTRNEYYDRGGEIKSIELSFPRKNMDKILSSYLPYVLERSKAIRKENRVLKLHSYNGSWESTNLDHPSTFETLAMDSKLKENLINDLDRFVRRSQFYRRVGKAWKRGYLLYGPPGTGKSSLIAAMANYLKFDIYDLELTSLHSNYELRRLLVSTKNQSILVIEDIDCSVALQDRRSGGCGQGNSQTFSNHKLFPEIEKLLMEVEVTPAEIAEEFMKSEDADVALETS
ncbi:AAA-ATPase [Vitis vinifera]|uniref:AAA-ATPase n=1 Tax=Vitis vinifera TaxID=29760 RepID=A0A438I291_VITVI|nr:AAA-ATPase [Vitis vinifera]